MEIGYAKRLFITTKKSENVTPRTLETYDRGLKRFFDYLLERNIFDVSEVNTGIIREFLIMLKEKGLRGITVHQSFRILRTLFSLLYREDYITKNPMAAVKDPKVEQKEMRTFNAQEIIKILNAFDKNDFIGMRNYCVRCLFFSTGIRKRELTTPTLADINIITEFMKTARQSVDNPDLFIGHDFHIP